MTEKNLNILLVAGTILIISLGSFFYLRPVSYRSTENKSSYQPSIPSIEESSSAQSSSSSIEEPSSIDFSSLINAIGQPGTSTETSTLTSTTPDPVEKDAGTTSQEKTDTKQACLMSGGRIAASLCCKSANDFPNSCLIGSCGCSPDDSKATMICECGEGKCFDGTECVTLE